MTTAINNDNLSLPLVDLPQRNNKTPLQNKTPHLRLGSDQTERVSNQGEAFRDRKIHPINYSLIFSKNLESHIFLTKKLERAEQNKATLMKVLFIGFLVLGILCAASFFLLPVIGNIAGILGLSVATTTIAWEGIFLGGGLVAGLSFFPRRFIKGFEENKNHYHQKADALRLHIQKGHFENFLKAELKGYKNPQMIASSPDFADLFYLSRNLNEKKLEIDKIGNELSYIKNFIKPQQNLTAEEKKKQIDFEDKIEEVSKKLQEMKKEVKEIENETNDLRVNLTHLDRGTH